MGCSNAQAIAYLPWGSLERWKKPHIAIILVHQRGDAASLLSLTLGALAEAHYIGDRVELRVVLHAGAARNQEVYCISIVCLLVLGRVCGVDFFSGFFSVSFESYRKSVANIDCRRSFFIFFI